MSEPSLVDLCHDAMTSLTTYTKYWGCDDDDAQLIENYTSYCTSNRIPIPDKVQNNLEPDTSLHHSYAMSGQMYCQIGIKALPMDTTKRNFVLLMLRRSLKPIFSRYKTIQIMFAEIDPNAFYTTWWPRAGLQLIYKGSIAFKVSARVSSEETGIDPVPYQINTEELTECLHALGSDTDDGLSDAKGRLYINSYHF